MRYMPSPPPVTASAYHSIKNLPRTQKAQATHLIVLPELLVYPN